MHDTPVGGPVGFKQANERSNMPSWCAKGWRHHTRRRHDSVDFIPLVGIACGPLAIEQVGRNHERGL
jgi:hypothetical protein